MHRCSLGRPGTVENERISGSDAEGGSGGCIHGDHTPTRVLHGEDLSEKLPIFTFPKLTVSVGLTEKLDCATALAPIEQGLSSPLVFTAVTET